MNRYFSIDLFSGCGGLSEGMREAGFEVKIAIEIDHDSVLTYKMNHPQTNIIQKDIRKVGLNEVKELLNIGQLHLLAACPPCQGFSSVRRLNRKDAVQDKRNDLIVEYLRFVRELKPLTLMMENVPGLINYSLFRYVVEKLTVLGYHVHYDVVNLSNYGIPQRRKRLVMVGSLLGQLEIAKGIDTKVTVRDVIGKLESVESTDDTVHKIVANHSERIKNLIALVPPNGGSRKELPIEYSLECHQKKNVGFDDIYGRLPWDDYSSTITGGCLNPSKGRFLHPDKNRTITAREAALLQTFPRNYKFPIGRISKTSIALQIGNALPPKFSYKQCKNIINHLDKYLG